MDAKERRLLENILDEFNLSKYHFRKEIDSALEFYSSLDSLSRSLRYLKMPQERIEKLLSVLKRLQNILFQIPPYRDHLPHQLRVYLIGCYILHEEDLFMESLSERYAQIITGMIKRTDPKHYELIKEEIFYSFLGNLHLVYDAWALAAFYHDIGYSIQGIPIILNKLHEIYGELMPNLSVKVVVDILPSEIMRTQIESFEDCIKFLYGDDGDELRKCVSNLKKRKDHGIWGAFFVVPHDLAGKLKENIKRLRQRILDLRVWDLVSGFGFISETGIARDLLPILYVDALIAIAFHNKPYLIYLSPFMTLLVISDTLQEWNRIGYVNFKESYLPRSVYIRFLDKLRSKVIESQIHVYDCPPQDFYNRLVRNFDAKQDKELEINIDKIQKRFMKGLKFIVRIGPPIDRFPPLEI